MERAMLRYAKNVHMILKRNRHYLLASCTLFSGAVLAGVFWTIRAPGPAEEWLRLLSDPVQRIASELANRTLPEQALLVFYNNIRVVLLMLTGAFLLGLGPLLVLVSNGMLLGLFAAHLAVGGEPLIWRFLAALAPHGVVEIPAILLAGAFGLRLGHEIIRALVGRVHKLSEALRETLAVGPLLFVFLLVAAFVEVYISPLLL